METPANYGIEFKPNRSRANASIPLTASVLIMIVGAAITVKGLVEYFQTGDVRDSLTGGSAAFAVGLGIFLVIWYLTVPFNVHYFVGKEGLTLKVFFTTLPLPYSEIESLTHLSEKQSEKMVLQGWNQVKQSQAQGIQTAAAAKGEGDMETVFDETRKMFSAQTNWFKKYKFMSVALAFSGNSKTNIAGSADLPCDTVLILLKNGEGYFISPKDIPGFLEEAKKFILK